MSRLSRQGTFYLPEAMLDILFEHYPERCGLGAADISKSAGICREPRVVHLNEAIVTGCLSELPEQGKVVQKAQKNGSGGCPRKSTQDAAAMPEPGIAARSNPASHRGGRVSEKALARRPGAGNAGRWNAVGGNGRGFGRCDAPAGVAPPFARQLTRPPCFP